MVTEQQLGPMPFDDEGSGDADADRLDTICTPSDSLSKSISKYSAFTESGKGCTSYRGPGGIVRDRQLAKYKFCGEFKLYHKLARLRTYLDELFDNYLKTGFNCQGDLIHLKYYPIFN